MVEKNRVVSQESDQALIKHAQEGDTHAFDEIVKRYQHKITRLIHYYVPDASECLDLTQEVFIKVYSSLSKFRGDSAFYTWLYRVAINTVKNYVILSHYRTPTVDVEVDRPGEVLSLLLPKNTDTPEHCLLRDEIESKIFDVIDELPNDARVAFALREMEGLSYEEIADVMDCPVGTVRSRIFRAREAIENDLKVLMNNDQ